MSKIKKDNPIDALKNETLQRKKECMNEKGFYIDHHGADYGNGRSCTCDKKNKTEKENRTGDKGMKKKKRMKSAVIAVLCLLVVGIGSVFGINGYVKSAASDQIITSEEAAKLTDVDCILVLGCLVKDDGTPSDMLGDRLTRGIEVYNLGAAPKLLMSGDHGRKEYDEVGTMKQYAIDAGISSEDIFMDHAGFSTYESVYRAKKIFEADKIIIITQEYHLYRALYIAEKLGVDAYGVASDDHTYAGQPMRECREILARCKDFVMTICKPEPAHMGEVIPVSGNGDQTNDD